MGTPLRSGTTGPGSIVHDDKVTIDLRRKPTREDLGFQPGRNDRSYQRGAGIDAIVTTVELPTGSVRIPAFVITADGGDFVSSAELPPRNIVVQRLFDTSSQALQSLIADAPTLGFSEQDVESLLSRVASTAGTPAPQQGVLNGLVQDWLAIYAEVIGYEDGTVGVNYTFTIDQFHNPATDKVVHDGVFAIDLTHRPSREELAFLDDSNTARVQPAWNETLSVRLTLPDGVIQRPVRSVDSTATQTVVSLVSSSIPDAQEALTADAPVLGVKPSDVHAVFTGGPGHVKTTLPGLKTAFYDVTVNIDATLGQPGAFAAAVSYTFTYH
ncbi:MAG: hypothetical protein M3308_01985 [Actinomycetota bacterium]|nr:hypothetical protein [Actinomycetota bacterium]